MQKLRITRGDEGQIWFNGECMGVFSDSPFDCLRLALTILDVVRFDYEVQPHGRAILGGADWHLRQQMYIASRYFDASAQAN